ncbi:relaxase/mobilization nuclease domain-containing protein [Chitinophaga barathri]|uniref:MobA/VirD2-like nuclease domain-containing protein n=1 Tax=Chitinophaga barathri TaxID=1647451 RepID=A0A3N4MCL3_9BACT|nr:relaxase/mobilization nuclease domain-containing protein [Chitinophaga barathri]RPD41278.1 hypothetical protein EG028_11415 [Chitinophaga barathri]
MISKVLDGHHFYHACRYICNKDGAEVIAAEGVREYNYKYMADDFIQQAGLLPSRTQACFHAVLSFYPGEKPTDETLEEIGRKYLESLGVTDTQFAIAKHTDRAHLHLHIIANMVDNSGVWIDDGWIAFRGKKVAQQLTKDYRLTPANRKDLSLTNLEALSQMEENRYRVYAAILHCLPSCRYMGDLEMLLKEMGIETIYKYKGQTTERQGVSFKYGDDVFKGSKVDRKFSLANLEKIMAAQFRNSQQATPKAQVLSAPQQPVGKMITSLDQSLSELVNGLAKGAGDLLEDLLKPEYSGDTLPYELLKEARKRKKKGRKQ